MFCADEVFSEQHSTSLPGLSLSVWSTVWVLSVAPNPHQHCCNGDASRCTRSIFILLWILSPENRNATSAAVWELQRKLTSVGLDKRPPKTTTADQFNGALAEHRDIYETSSPLLSASSSFCAVGTHSSTQTVVFTAVVMNTLSLALYRPLEGWCLLPPPVRKSEPVLVPTSSDIDDISDGPLRPIHDKTSERWYVMHGPCLSPKVPAHVFFVAGELFYLVFNSFLVIIELFTESTT